MKQKRAGPAGKFEYRIVGCITMSELPIEDCTAFAVEVELLDLNIQSPDFDENNEARVFVRINDVNGPEAGGCSILEPKVGDLYLIAIQLDEPTNISEVYVDWDGMDYMEYGWYQRLRNVYSTNYDVGPFFTALI